MVEAGDRATVAAVRAAPAYLSGLKDSEQALIRDLAAAKLAPTDHAQLCATREVLDRVAAAGGRVVGRYTKVIQAADSPAARASKRVAELADGGQ